MHLSSSLFRNSYLFFIQAAFWCEAFSYAAFYKRALLALVLALVMSGFSNLAWAQVFFDSRISSMDFQRTQQGYAQIILGFADAAFTPEVENLNKGLKLSFPKTLINQELINSYDTSDFATQVKDLDVFQAGSQVQVFIGIEEPFSYVLSTDQKELKLEITPKAKPAKQGAGVVGSRYTGDLISLSYHNIPLRSLLAELASFLDLSLVAGDKITGDITLELDQVPSDQALDLILISQGLASRQQGKVLLIAPAEDLLKLEESQMLAKQAIANSGQLEEAFIKIRYAQAKSIQEFLVDTEAAASTSTPSANPLAGLLPGGNLSSLASETSSASRSLSSTGGFLSSRGQLLVDERTNTIYIRDLPEQVTQIKNIIAALDVPVEQVMIEARIVVARNGVSDDLGVSWGATSAKGGVSESEVKRELDIGRLETEKNLISSGRTSTLQMSPESGFNFGFVSENLLLDLELAALETENRSEIISQPKVITSNRNKAVIRSGEEIPYSSTNSDGERTTNFRQAELRLEVTPQIVGDGRIFLDLQVNNDSKGEETLDAGPTINTNAVETQVLAQDGQTIVIGGIFTSEHLEGETKIKFLGDLPLIGWLFRREFSSQEKVELLVFITPKMISSDWGTF